MAEMKNIKNDQGFTMIELISIMVILGIMGAILGSRMVDDRSEAVAASHVIKSHLRYAQTMAMQSNKGCGIVFNHSTYSIFRNSNLLDRITLPGNDGTDFPIPTGLGTASETLYFDLWGIPYTNAALTTLRPTGQIGTLGINLTLDTGFVQ